MSLTRSDAEITVDLTQPVESKSVINNPSDSEKNSEAVIVAVSETVAVENSQSETSEIVIEEIPLNENGETVKAQGENLEAKAEVEQKVEVTEIKAENSVTEDKKDEVAAVEVKTENTTTVEEKKAENTAIAEEKKAEIKEIKAETVVTTEKKIETPKVSLHSSHATLYNRKSQLSPKQIIEKIEEDNVKKDEGLLSRCPSLSRCTIL